MNSLLPPNATPLERAVEQLILRSFYDRPRLIAGAKFNPLLRPSLHPYLVHEWGLAPLEHYLPREQILDEGVSWSRIRGTVAAVEQALGWIGFSPIVEESSATSWFNRLQIDPGRVPVVAEVPHLLNLARLSLPARARIARLYHGWDIRHARAGTSRAGTAILSADSGVLRDGVVQSYGQRLAGDGDLSSSQAEGQISVLFAGHLHLSPRPRCGSYRLSGAIPTTGSGVMGALITGSNAEPNANYSLHARVRRIPRAALVAGAVRIGTINSRASGGYPVSWPVDGWIAGQSTLSGRRAPWFTDTRPEFFDHHVAGTGDIDHLFSADRSQTTLHASNGAVSTEQLRWAGSWGARSWSVPSGSGNHITEES